MQTMQAPQPMAAPMNMAPGGPGCQVRYQNNQSITYMNLSEYNQYQGQLPPLNKVNMDFNSQLVQTPDMNSNMGFNPFQNSQYRVQYMNSHMINMNGAGPIKVIQLTPNANGVPGSYMMGGNKIILRAMPLQQVIQVPMSQIQQMPYNQNNY